MPSLTTAVPKYRKKKVNGGKNSYAVVCINGREHVLGPYNSRASKAEYDRLIGQFIASGRSAGFGRHEQHVMTLRQLVIEYGRWAKEHDIRADGTPTGTHQNMRSLMTLLLKHYGSVPVTEFRALAFRDIIGKLIASGVCISTVNDRIARVKHLFRWASQREYIQPDQLVSINTIQGEERGRSKAKPAREVEAVPDAHVILTLPHLPEVVADIVRLQRFTGMRPQEVCDIKFGGILTINGNIYYYPKHHKTIHKGKIRAVPLNANALSILSKYSGSTDEFIFSPKKSRERQIAIRTAKRVTPLSCGTKPKRDRILKGGDHYTSCSYRRAIYRACDRLFFGIKGYKWSPNQLRHAAAVEIDTEHGIEAVGAALGHSKIAISRRYAKQNLKLATKAVGSVGAALVG